MRIYDYMKGILGAMGVGEDVGVPEPSWRIEEYLKAIYDKLKEGGGGSSLPPVTSSDNGKVLAVANGAWAADSNLFIVTKDSGNTADKTLDEVKAAVAAGKTVILKYASSGNVDVAVYAGEYYGVVYFATLQSDSSYDYMFYMNGGKSLTQVRWTKLPRTSSSDNGSELIVKNGNWAKQKKKFVVTLTPTSPDYSGTMDKTVAEINAAYEAGQEIVFRVHSSATGFNDVKCTIVYSDEAYQYPSFNAYMVADNLFVFAATYTTDDGTKQTYSTDVYSLTPAS
jgi:hypothetical protein